MKIPTLPMARGRGLFRTFLVAAVSLFAFAGTSAKAQTEEDLLAGALDPILQLLDTEGLLDLDLLDLDDPTALIDEITSILGGTDILGDLLDGSIDEDLLDDVAVALEDTLIEVQDLLDSGELTDPTVLDPLRELLLSVLDILLGIGGDDVLGFLGIGDLLPAEDLLDLGILDLDILDSLLGDLLLDGGLIASISDLLDGLLGGLLGGLLPDNIADLITVIIDLINPVLEPDDPPAPAPTSSAGVDLIAGKRGGVGKGNDIYGTYSGQRFTSKHRTRKKFKAPSRHAFTVENDSRVTIRPTLKGTRNKRFLRIQYLVEGTNKTGAIRSGRYNQKSVTPGASYVVKVKTTARRKLRKANGELLKKKAVIRLKARSSQGSDRAMLRLKTGGK